MTHKRCPTDDNNRALTAETNLTFREIYDAELADKGPVMVPPNDADEDTQKQFAEADYQRWIALRMAVASKANYEYIEKLEKASTPQELAEAQRHDHTVLGMTEMLKDPNYRKQILENADLQREIQEYANGRTLSLNDLKDLYASLTVNKNQKQQERTLDVAPIVPDRAITKNEVAELRKKLNVFVRAEQEALDTEDPEFVRLRNNAEQADSFVRTGMALRKETEDGITEETDDAIKQRFLDDAIAASSAMLAFQEYRDNPQTRDDGRHDIMTRVDLNALGKRMRKQTGNLLESIEFCGLCDSTRVRSKIIEQRRMCLNTLAALPICDMPVYTPRLFSVILGGEAVPRAMSFSEVYAGYVAFVHMARASDLLGTSRERNRKIRKRNKEMKKAKGVKLIKAKKFYDTLPTRQTVFQTFEKHRLEARKIMEENLADLFDHYESIGPEGVLERIDEAPENVQSPYHDSLYAEVYRLMHEHCVEILNTFEMTIVQYLARYLVGNEFYELCTRNEMVCDSVLHPDYWPILENMNQSLTSLRLSTCMQMSKEKPLFSFVIPPTMNGARVRIDGYSHLPQLYHVAAASRLFWTLSHADHKTVQNLLHTAVKMETDEANERIDNAQHTLHNTAHAMVPENSAKPE